MYSLTIVFGPQATTWTLLFKEKEKAEAADIAIREGGPVTDDYGQTANLNKWLPATMIEDLELSKEAHAVKAVHQARTMALAETMARADPDLKAAHSQAQQRARLAGGPPIISTVR